LKEPKPEGLKDFLKVQNFINEKIEYYKSELAKIDEKIESTVSKPLNQVRLLQGKDTGTIAAMIEDVEVKQDVPKKVVWDQDKLRKVRAKILLAGDVPDNYMSAKFSISEKSYNAFFPEIKAVFAPAREVKPGKAKLSFKLKEV
jgi:hypothetical protein